MLELLAPAGSMEAVAAAVQNGADAVYLGYGDFNARRNAKNFSEEEFAAAVSYCHLRGAKVYLTLNTLLTDRELPKAAEVAAQASAIGADAVLIQDLGVLRMLRQVAPDLPVHAVIPQGVVRRRGHAAVHGIVRQGFQHGQGVAAVNAVSLHSRTHPLEAR